MKIVVMIGMACSFLFGQGKEYESAIYKNGMTVSWYHKAERIFFKMRAPTIGWVTIGFNESTSIKGSYLLMGHIKKGSTKVIEYVTLSPGNYKPLSTFNLKSQVMGVKGKEKKEETEIFFSLPIKAVSPYRKDLLKGKKYTLVMAYSQEDDFQHHSIMRTAVLIEL